jgi:hypothetical protein
MRSYATLNEVIDAMRYAGTRTSCISFILAYIHIYRAMKQIDLLYFNIKCEHSQALDLFMHTSMFKTFKIGPQVDLDTSNTSSAIPPCITRKQKILDHLFRVLYAKVLDAASRLCINKSINHSLPIIIVLLVICKKSQHKFTKQDNTRQVGTHQNAKLYSS